MLVIDDDSTDAAAGIVRKIAYRDPREPLLKAPPLTAVWISADSAQASSALFASIDLSKRISQLANAS